MKRELKPNILERYNLCLVHCRAYPDEKGIETGPVLPGRSDRARIAEPIPMKRELKLLS